ncbi:hypothetical protein SO802_001701 [Lithocarpus litseifolius]|uniref:Uncharacterized protein n=1 Tax=Lithocarpus litseifolius TaxID=425828 RepID=A0AAW2DV58_9ROSI
MAETKHQEEEPALHPKRKPDLSREDNEDNPHKAQKLEPPPPDTSNDSSLPLHKNHHLEPSPLDSSIPEQNDAKFESNLLAEVEDDDDDDDDDEEEEEEYEDEDEDDDDGDSENGDEKAVVDRKGKGIMRDDKGKGKLIEEENDDDDDEDDDDSDSDIGSDVSDGESDLSDDPLAEVDLDNILPSRTRRRTVQPGIHIANDHRHHNKNHDDGDSGA